jgi:glucose-specific phosphotransferase system IIA component
MKSDLGPAFYAAGKRLLIPVGLHHVYYAPFLFEFGEFMSSAGKVLHGESARYFAGDPSAGRFMASEFPLMLFGLPAATVAMYLAAPKNRRRIVAGVMISAALTSIITGITEPIEFAFIFVAPPLYFFHVAAAFVSGLLTGFFDIHLGYTFSASAIDFILGAFNSKNSMYLFTVVGPVIALLYFGVFYWSIRAFNFKTPGREDEETTVDTSAVAASDKASGILEAIGGAGNVTNIDACITRLRLKVKNGGLVKVSRLKELGAAGVLDAGSGNFQLVFGVESDRLKEEIKHLIAGGAAVAATVATRAASSASSGSLTLVSPMAGSILPITDVPDATFAEKVLGDGFAIDPSEGVVYAPVNCEVVNVFRTQHALGLVTDSGVEILIHVGLDTVKMEGRGFKSLVKVGDKVKAGDRLLEFDLNQIRSEGKSTISPVVITNMQVLKSFNVLREGSVAAKENILKVGV